MPARTVRVDLHFALFVSISSFNLTFPSLLLSVPAVVVEKPITPTFAEAQELVALAKATGKVLATYHSRRFDSDFLTVKSLIEEGAFGELSELDSHYDRYKVSVSSLPSSRV